MLHPPSPDLLISYKPTMGLTGDLPFNHNQQSPPVPDGFRKEVEEEAEDDEQEDISFEAEEEEGHEAIIKQASKSFYMSSLLLPRRLRSAVMALYAWCRLADDDIDEASDPEAKIRNWTRQWQSLERIYAASGTPTSGLNESGLNGSISVTACKISVDKRGDTKTTTSKLGKDLSGGLTKRSLPLQQDAMTAAATCLTTTKKHDNNSTKTNDASPAPTKPTEVDDAFAKLVHRYGMPHAFPAAQLEGQLWDCQERRYETLDDLVAYCERVASSVGLMMCVLMRAPAVSYPYARALGVAMQLTNIARDVGEDARNGKIYLPLSWLREEGITPESLLKPPVKFSAALGRVVKRLLDTADRFYNEAEPGIAMLPKDCQLAVLAASRIYQHIKDGIIANDYDSVSSRASTTQWQKIQLIFLALLQIHGLTFFTLFQFCYILLFILFAKLRCSSSSPIFCRSVLLLTLALPLLLITLAWPAL